MIHREDIQVEESYNLNEIVNNKQSGFKRSNPQDNPEFKKGNEIIFHCEQCGKEFKNRNI